MPRPKKDYDRVIGVYGRTVIRYDVAKGKRITETLEDESAARTYAEGLNNLFAREALTVAGAAQEWLCTKDCAEISRDAMRVKLGSFLEGLLSMSPEEVTPALCRERYAALIQEGYAVSTHHARLQVAQEFFSWCVVKGYAKSNPAATIKPEGTPNRGKPQLTLDEARSLAGVLFAEINQKGACRQHALIILSCLYLGTRVSEVLFRVVRDLDDRGTVLRIPYGKSKNAVRRLRLPEELQSLWREQARDKLPTARLFSLQRTTITNRTYAFCERAGVPGVCPHSFRGLHATLEMQHGGELSVVARGLGNTPAVSQRHYVQAGTMEQARTDRAVEFLRVPKNDSM